MVVKQTRTFADVKRKTAERKLRENTTREIKRLQRSGVKAVASAQLGKITILPQITDPELFDISGKPVTPNKEGIISGYSKADLVKIKAQESMLQKQGRKIRTELLRGQIPTSTRLVERKIERDVKRIKPGDIPTAQKIIRTKPISIINFNKKIEEGLRKGKFQDQDIKSILKISESKATIRPTNERIIQLAENKFKSRQEELKKKEKSINKAIFLVKKIEYSNKRYLNFVDVSLSKLGLKGKTAKQRITKDVLKTLSEFNPAVITANIVGGVEIYRTLRKGKVIKPKEIIAKGISSTIPLAKKTLKGIKNLKPEDIKKATQKTLKVIKNLKPEDIKKAKQKTLEQAIKLSKNIDPRTEKGITNLIVLGALFRVDKLALKGLKKGIGKSIALNKKVLRNLEKQGITFEKPTLKEVISSITPTKLLKSKAARTKGAKGISKAELRKRAFGQITRQQQVASKKKAIKAEKLQVFVAKGKKPKEKIKTIIPKTKKELEIVQIEKKLSPSIKVSKREEVILERFKNLRKGKKTTTKEERRLAKKIAEGQIPLRDIPNFLKVRTTKTGKTKISFVKKPTIKKVTNKINKIQNEQSQITIFKKTRKQKKEKPIKFIKLTKTETRKKQRQLEKARKLGFNRINQKFATADLVKIDLRPEIIFKDLIILEETQIKGFRKGQASKLFAKIEAKKQQLINKRKKEAFDINRKLSKGFLKKEFIGKELNKKIKLINKIKKGEPLTKLQLYSLNKFSDDSRLVLALSQSIKNLIAIDQKIKNIQKIKDKIKIISKIKPKTDIKIDEVIKQEIKKIIKKPRRKVEKTTIKKIKKPRRPTKQIIKKIITKQPIKSKKFTKITLIKKIIKKPRRKVEKTTSKKIKKPKIDIDKKKLKKVIKKIKIKKLNPKKIDLFFTPTLLQPSKKKKKINGEEIKLYTGLELRGF